MASPERIHDLAGDCINFLHFRRGLAPGLVRDDRAYSGILRLRGGIRTPGVHLQHVHGSARATACVAELPRHRQALAWSRKKNLLRAQRSADLPVMSEWVHYSTKPPSIWLILDWVHMARTGFDRLSRDNVRILDDQCESD